MGILEILGLGFEAFYLGELQLSLATLTNYRILELSRFPSLLHFICI